jgi:hypothetical protein
MTTISFPEPAILGKEREALGHDDPHAYKLNYLEGVGYHSIISRGAKSGDMYNEFIVK